MKLRRRSAIMKCLLIGLALLPALLFAYLGHYSRLLGDEYRWIPMAAELGAWQNMLHWRAVWMSSYSGIFLTGLLASLDAALPSIFAVFAVGLWLLGAAWLLWQVLELLGVKRHRLALAISVAGLLIAASMNAFYSSQSLYWYAANMAYTLPTALLCWTMSLLLAASRRIQMGGSLLAWAGASAVCGFIWAGFSEAQLIFQLAFLPLLLLAAFAVTGGELRRNATALIGAGCLGTLGSLAVQWTSPGRLVRTALTLEYPQFQPIRDPLTLMRHALADIYQLAIAPETVLGFVLLLAMGWLGGRAIQSTRLPLGAGSRAHVAASRLPYLVALIVQALFAPLLWTHASDVAQVFGRYSYAFALVVAINVAMLVLSCLLLWHYGHLRAFLRRSRRRSDSLAGLAALLALMMMAAPQLRSMHVSASNFLFATALSWLFVAWLEWTAQRDEAAARHLSLLAFSSALIALLSTAALITVPRMFVGIGDPRHWTSPALLLTAQGLIWGVTLGYGAGRLGKRGEARLKLACLAAAGLVYGSIILSQSRDAPNLATYAREWDERHSLLTELRAQGQRDVLIPPREFDLAAFILRGEIGDDATDGGFYHRVVLDYYDLASITLLDEAEA